MEPVSADVEQSLVEECVGSAHGDLDKVRELVERHPRLVNARAPWNETPVEAATQLGRRDIIEFLLERGAPLDLFTACVLGRRDVVEADIGGQREVAEMISWLLSHGADATMPDFDGRSAPRLAEAMCRPDLAHLFD